ncbi:MAG: hypothetical protein ACREQ9_01105, partial [Candidatus Binatia bacterium]
LLHLPFATEPRLFEGLATYASLWSYNTAGLALVERFVALIEAPGELARPLAGAIAAAVAIVAASPVRIATADGSIRAATVAIAALVVMAPAVNPWYVAWLVPFFALVRSPALLALTLTVLAYYSLPLAGDAFSFVRGLEFAVPAALLIAGRRGSVRSAASSRRLRRASFARDTANRAMSRFESLGRR